MMPNKPRAYSIRSYLDDLRRKEPQSLLEIQDEVDPDYEVTAYYLHFRKRNPVLLFGNVKGHRTFSLVTNIFGSEDRLARLAGFQSINEVIENWARIAGNNPASIRAPPAVGRNFHSIISGESLNIFDLPIPSHYETDGSKTGNRKYITAGIMTTRDPENRDSINLSFARIQPFSRDKFAFDAGSHGHLWKHLKTARERGESIEATVLIGPNPVFYLLAASFIDNEFLKVRKLFSVDFEGGFRNDIPIPSDTEIVLEAEFSPEESFDEGPFAEYTGYIGYDSTKFVAKVRSILLKKDPIYYDIHPSNSSEHVNLFSIPRSSIVMNSIREALPKGPLYEVRWPHYGGRFICFGFVDKAEPGLAQQLGISIIGSDPLWNKFVFINEGRTELDIRSALVNLAQERVFDGRNVLKFSEMYVISSDPTRDDKGVSGKIVFISHGNAAAKEERKGDIVMLETKGGKIVISHDPIDEGEKISVVVPGDIDTGNCDQVGWAIATRSDPARDIEIGGGRICFNATRKVAPVPSIPNEIKEKIERRLRSFS
ncbi:MAG: UbiD family decarboxylase [Thermoplasmatales archaeon]